MLEHPEIARRDCGECTIYQFDEDGKKVWSRRQNAYLRRPRGGKPPCRISKGCPKGTPEEPKTLSLRHRLTYTHYLECKATGMFPDDAIVRRNAALIRTVEDATSQGFALKAAMLGALAKKQT